MLKRIITQSFIIILVLASFSNIAFSQNAPVWKRVNDGDYPYRYVDGDPTNTRYYMLKNRLTVILAPNPKEPRIQTYIAVRAGSKTDPATNTGLAHYLEHMLFKGTDKFGSLDWSKEKPLLDQIDALYEKYNTTKDEAKRKEIYKEIDKVSGEAAKYAIANEYDKMMAAMGTKGTNAWTSFEETVYTEDVPSNAINKYLAVQAERFRNPILRIFHTELEAVYEEKNRGLDNDGRKTFEKMFELMFANHNYGKQTTIGTIEHLKNPSLVEIRKYFHKYYVPNNMGIIMSGDFNPDEVIKEIDKAFSYLTPNPVPPYTFEPEKEITQPIIGNVVGPEPEFIMMGYRFPGASHKDAQILELVGKVLTNGSAGLMDLNLVQQQKLLGAYAFTYLLKDYSMLILQGRPTEGQSLDEVRKLILTEIDKLKSGAFGDDLLQAIVNNERKSAIETNENYSSLAYELVNYFTTDLNWANRVAYVNNLSSISKKDIIDFANKYLNENYIAVYKKQGEDKDIVKVEKPTITPVPINTEAQSDFSKMVQNMPENKIEPQWLDFSKDINRGKVGSFDLLSIPNKDNELFRLYYFFETGSWANKLLPLAAEYVNYIGTSKKDAASVSKEFYALASSFNISVGNETSTISLDGLNDNFVKSAALLEELLLDCKADKEALEAYKGRLKKARENAKKNKGQIMRGLVSYAQYGAKNPFNNELTDKELEALTAEDLINVIKTLLKYDHKVLYYGPMTVTQLSTALPKVHRLNKMANLPLPKPAVFNAIDQNKNSVLFAHYDMVQAEVQWIRNSTKYDAGRVPVISLFNEYFGGGMGSIVFQTIRESKALAYSTYAVYSNASNKAYRNNLRAYVGTQSDKFSEAIAAMNEILDELPKSEKALATAQDGLRKSLATQKITQESIIFAYLRADKLGLDYDIRKKVYEQINKISFADLQQFHKAEFSKKPYTYCVLGHEEKINKADINKLGEVKVLSLEDIFGY